MRINTSFFIAVLIIVNASFSQTGSSGVQPFLPEITSQFPNLRDVAISPSHDEIYFTMQSILNELSEIVVVKKKKNSWSKPEIAVFSGRFNDLEPAFSPDGLKLFFVSNRPVDSKSDSAKDFDIWYVERSSAQSPWSDPIRLDTIINTCDNQFYPSLAISGNLYFTCDAGATKGKDDIFVSKWIDGKYQTPVSMSDSINSPGYEFNAYVAPDESFLLYTCYNRAGGLGSGDLYISYNRGNDGWTASKNLDEKINSRQMDYCPFVDIPSKTLYFTSRRSTVPSQFNSPQNIGTVMKEVNKYENGLSRLYQVNIGDLLK